jgi:predicted nucleotide-binding protein
MTASTPAPSATASGRTPRIAVLCREDAAGQAVTTFIADLGLEPVIIQPPASAASFDALESLRNADFAVLLQVDRQLELGFLLAALGRSKLIVLQPGEGAGLAGLPHQRMDDAGLWRLMLAREMKKAGIEVDLNRAM